MAGFESTTHSLSDGNQNRSRSVWGILEHLFLPEKDPLSVFLILGGITLLGLILRLLEINKQIGYDEAYTFVQFASRPFKHILADYSAPNNHIFHTILVGIAYRLLGGQPWALRLPALLAGILIIPAMYITARRFFSPDQAVAASGLAAVTPLFIHYSVNGRGYTLLVLFALLLANFAGILVVRGTRPALIAFVLTAALGFYTIPVFLYPMAGICLWVMLTYWFTKEPWQDRLRRLGTFLGACLIAGLLTFVLYSPVIFFGSGLSSIVGNEIVKSLNWSTFLENLDPRINQAWDTWMMGIRPALEYLLLGGFLISVFFHRRVSNQKLPMQVFLALAAAILLVLQRVTPLPRIWIYLEAFFLMFAAAGLVWLADLTLRKAAGPTRSERMLLFAIPLVFVVTFTQILIAREQNPVFADRDLLPEAYAADYIADHLQPEDTIIATGPVDIQTAYYLILHGIPFDRFYKRGHPLEFRNALVILRENSKYKTPESVANFLKLDQVLDLPAAELVFEYASVQIYSIPVKR